MGRQTRTAGLVSAAALSLAAGMAGADTFGWGWQQWQGNGHWYRVERTSGVVSWAEARALAEGWGGHLATITSPEENAFVTAMSNAPDYWYDPFGGGFSGPWLGMARLPEFGGQLGWITGEPVSFTNFAPGEPNNLRGSENGVCFGNGRGSGQWIDFESSGSPLGLFPLKFSYAVESPSRPPEAQLTYEARVRGLIATEVFRTAYAQTPNPRVAAVITAIGVVCARNPNITPAQLAQFVQAYDAALAAVDVNDPTLGKPLAFHSAVRFEARVTNVPGVDTDIGQEVLEVLALEPTGTTRERTVAALHRLQSPRFASHPEFGDVLINVFSGRDARGNQCDAARDAVLAYLRSVDLDVATPGVQPVEPCPTLEQLAAQYPGVLAGLQSVPATFQQFAAEQAAGFPNLTSRIDAEIDALGGMPSADPNAPRSFITRQIDQFSQLEQQYPSPIDSGLAGTAPAVIQAALQDRRQDLLEISRARSILTFNTQLLLEGALDQNVEANARKRIASTHIWLADETASSVSTIMTGVGTILSGTAAFASGPVGAIGFTGSLISGVGILLPEIIPGDNTPSPYQQLSDQIFDLQNQVEDLRFEMSNRFDRVDAQLVGIYDAVTTGFDAMNLYLQGISQDVGSLQLSAAISASNLNRMEQNLGGILSGLLNFPQVQTMNNVLGASTVFGFNSFRTDMNQFYTDGFSNADEPAFAGPDASSIGDPYGIGALNQLGNYQSPTGDGQFGYGYNINFIRTLPQMLGLQPLSAARLHNPTTWTNNADAFTQFARENPWHAARLISLEGFRVDDLLSAGNRLKSAIELANNPSHGMVLRTLSDARPRIVTLDQRFTTAVNATMTSFPLVDLYGGASQSIPQAQWPDVTTPTRIFINNAPGSQVCSSFPCYLSYVPNTNQIPSSAPYQGAGTPKRGWEILDKTEHTAAYLQIPGFTWNDYVWTYRPQGAPSYNVPFSVDSSGQYYTGVIDVELWRRLPNSTLELVATRRFTLRMTSFNPDWRNFVDATFERMWTSTAGGPSNPNLPIRDNFFRSSSTAVTNWQDGPGQPFYSRPVWEAVTIINQPARDRATAAVNGHLRGLQLQLYNNIVNALGNGADFQQIRVAADQLEATTLVFDALASLALPESMERSDVIRSYARGGDIGLSRRSLQRYFLDLSNELQQVPNGTATPARPSVRGELEVRLGLAERETAAALANANGQLPPSVRWSLAGLDDLRANHRRVAQDDQYVVAPGTTLSVPADRGLLANDAPDRGAAVTILSNTPATAGTVVVNANGSFNYTAPANFTGTATFTYVARADVNNGREGPAPITVDSLPATVVIRVEPCGILVDRAPSSRPLTPGNAEVFSVDASAPGAITYQWQRDGVNLTDGQRISGANSRTLTILNTSSADEGRYGVVMTGPCSSLTLLATLGDSCAADYNGDDIVNIFDIFQFFSLFAAADARADVAPAGSPDGLVNVFDVLEFFSLFGAGCP